MSQLELIDIEAGYKGTDILRGISLSVARGDCVAVLGPNGAGKSTLLKAISGQLKIRAGSRRLEGEDTTRWRTYKVAKAGIRWVGDPRPIYPSLSVEENLHVGGTVRRSQIDEKRDWIFDLLPMLKDKRTAAAGSLSGGQQQMLAIGQSLMSEPRYLCLDEPSLGLAPVVINSLSELIANLAESGVGVVWAEQFPEVALKRSSHVIVIAAGKVVLSGKPGEISRAELESAYLGTHAPAVTA